MNFLIYSRKSQSLVGELVSEYTGKVKTFHARDRQSFKRDYQDCFSGETLVLFFIEDPGDFDVLSSVSRYFVDVKLLIYLVGEAKTLMPKAFGYYPRWVTGSFEPDSHLHQVVAGILSDMSQNWEEDG